jgi:hypothetical protein
VTARSGGTLLKNAYLMNLPTLLLTLNNADIASSRAKCVAAYLNASSETVRKHLKTVFAKTAKASCAGVAIAHLGVARRYRTGKPE